MYVVATYGRHPRSKRRSLHSCDHSHRQEGFWFTLSSCSPGSCPASVAGSTYCKRWKAGREWLTISYTYDLTCIQSEHVPLATAWSPRCLQYNECWWAWQGAGNEVKKIGKWWLYSLWVFLYLILIVASDLKTVKHERMYAAAHLSSLEHVLLYNTCTSLLLLSVTQLQYLNLLINFLCRLLGQVN